MQTLDYYFACNSNIKWHTVIEECYKLAKEVPVVDLRTSLLNVSSVDELSSVRATIATTIGNLKAN